MKKNLAGVAQKQGHRLDCLLSKDILLKTESLFYLLIFFFFCCYFYLFCFFPSIYVSSLTGHLGRLEATYAKCKPSLEENRRKKQRVRAVARVVI